MRWALIFGIIFVLFSVSFAVSIGVSPADKTVKIAPNEKAYIYFTVSQGSEVPEDVTIKIITIEGGDWIEDYNPKKVTVQPHSQEMIIIETKPLQEGVYKAKIEASATEAGGNLATTVIAGAHITVEVGQQYTGHGDVTPSGEKTSFKIIGGNVANTNTGGNNLTPILIIGGVGGAIAVGGFIVSRFLI